MPPAASSSPTNLGVLTTEDLLPRIDDLVGLRQTIRLDGTSDGTQPLPVEFIVPPEGGAYERGGLRLRWAPCGVEDLVRCHGRPVTNGRRTAADLTRQAVYPESVGSTPGSEPATPSQLPGTVDVTRSTSPHRP